MIYGDGIYVTYGEHIPIRDNICASDKQDFLSEMILKYDPDIFIQETWLINSWRNVILRNICDLYMADGISAVRDNELMREGHMGVLLFYGKSHWQTL